MKDVKTLDEIDSYVLFSEHEDVFLFDKDSNREVWRTSMYGNATCGLLGLVNEWAVIGGKHLIIWINNKLQEIKEPDLKWIHDMRQTGDYEIEILIDPWSEKSAIWNLNIQTLKKSKVADFNDYKEKPYQDSVAW